MKPIYYRDFGVRVAEVWFEGPEGVSGGDIVRCMQTPEPVPGAWCEPFATLISDLSGSEDEVAAGMNRDTKYKVRRAESKDNLEYAGAPVSTADDLREFVGMNDEVSRQGNTTGVKLARLYQLGESGVLDVSSTRNKEGRLISCHVHLVTGGIARMLHSVGAFAVNDDQEFRRLCGRANRMHHWFDMKRFRAAGCDRYDFGGFYTGSTDEKRLQINFFKISFGGTQVTTYNCMAARSMLGTLAMVARRLKQRVKPRD